MAVDAPDALARFAALRAVITEALRDICPNGHRVFLFIAEPDGRMCVLTDWPDAQEQLGILKMLAERLELELGPTPPGSVH